MELAPSPNRIGLRNSIEGLSDVLEEDSAQTTDEFEPDNIPSCLIMSWKWFSQERLPLHYESFGDDTRLMFQIRKAGNQQGQRRNEWQEFQRIGLECDIASGRDCAL
jgi:hypothetical protein